jgi:hypothetical protein
MKTTNHATKGKRNTISLRVNLWYVSVTQKIKINILKNCERSLIKGITYNLDNLNSNTKRANPSTFCTKIHKR